VIVVNSPIEFSLLTIAGFGTLRDELESQYAIGCGINANKYIQEVLIILANSATFLFDPVDLASD
jgi:hypothetical protein